MKKLLLVSGLVFLFSTTVFANSAVEKTNLDKVRIGEHRIEYSNGAVEEIKNMEFYRGLFVNGSIVEKPDIIVVDNYTLVPLRIVSEELGAKVDWNHENRTVKITNGSTILELTIDSKIVTGNKKVDTMKIAPTIVNKVTYVPLRFCASVLEAKVDYFDGFSEKNKYVRHDDITDLNIVPRMSYVMINKYPEGAKVLSKSEAIEILRKELITAYEVRFKEKFVPLENYNAPENEIIGDEISFRSLFADGLYVRTENDRFYVVPVVFDFWVDKYTGDIFVFYNGQEMSISKFDPNSEYAIMFAG